MAKVIITNTLKNEIQKRFKQESIKIFELMKTLEKNPHKGKAIGNVANIIIKEIKYKNYRFYFITDGHMLKFAASEEVTNLIIRFVKMSDKKNQQKTINEIKNILKTLGEDDF